MIKAQIGDVMKVNVRHPHPQTFVLTLMTQAAADYATELLNDPNSGWRLERAENAPTAEGALKELQQRLGMETRVRNIEHTAAHDCACGECVASENR